MPYKLDKRGTKDRPYRIIRDGEVVGTSENLQNAMKSKSYRVKAEEKKKDGK